MNCVDYDERAADRVRPDLVSPTGSGCTTGGS